LLEDLLSDFKLQYDLPSGMEDLYHKMTEHRFSRKDFESDQFVRLRTIKRRMHLLA
jgi:hypothetical protein